MIKNTMCVIVPNTGDFVGIKASTIIGILLGDADKELEVISNVTPEAIEKIKELMEIDYCIIEHFDTDVQLHIQIEVYSNNNSAMVQIKYVHNNISKVVKMDKFYLLLMNHLKNILKYLLTEEDIYDFANTVNLDDISPLIEKQITCNMAISKEGLKGTYGVGIGNVILNSGDKNNIVTKMKACATAASEARMSGSTLPFVTKSGSENQGMIASVPVIVYAKEKGLSEDQLYRGLVFSNLITIHQKTGIGRLSAFCGAVIAGCATDVAITYLEGASVEKIEKL